MASTRSSISNQKWQQSLAHGETSKKSQMPHEAMYQGTQSVRQKKMPFHLHGWPDPPLLKACLLAPTEQNKSWVTPLTAVRAKWL